MADGSIILDTRVNTKGAEADLKALQAKAKSTAQQIALSRKTTILQPQSTANWARICARHVHRPQQQPVKSKTLTGHLMTRTTRV